MKVRIEIEWWNDLNESKVPENHKNSLIENAIDRISRMTEQGYVGGQLYSEILGKDHEPVKYNGYWKIKIN